MSRVIHWIADRLREPDAEPAPHFHRGPDAGPVVCFDRSCRSPHLDVRS